jgi:outer membrane protein assembly factor BamB
MLWIVAAFAVGYVVATMIVMPADITQSFAADSIVAATSDQLTGDWPQWGGSAARNNTPVGRGIPTDWDVGSFDRKTGRWKKDGSENVKWVSRVGSQTYGNPVVAGGRVFVGTNNGAGYLQRYPATVDLGCLVAFDQSTGKFLWQHSSEKLSTGRVHDWPLQGICCAPLVESDRLWFVTSRGEVVCVDTEGYYDDQDDGPVQGEQAKLFKAAPNCAASLDDGKISVALRAAMSNLGISLDGRLRVKSAGEGVWQVTVKGEETTWLRLIREGDELDVQQLDSAEATEGPSLGRVATDLTAGLNDGQANDVLRALLAAQGFDAEITAVETVAAGKKWNLATEIDGQQRSLEVRREGPNLAAYKLVTTADKQEADTIWRFDMMDELGVSQHNMCSCSVTALGDILFVNTSNGVDESHINIPNVDAPSFIAMNKYTGEVYWTDASPKENILHGQWSSPTVGEVGGVPQVIFGAGDGWVYSFKADQGQDGKPQLLWKFDGNPKESVWILGGRGTRNNIIATPVIHNDRVYVAVGQDPEHGEGVGHLWCIDPTKQGDVSSELAVSVDDRSTSIPHRRLLAVDPEQGEVAIDNSNSAVIWHYSQFDQNADGEFDFEETMHRSCGTVAIKNGLLFIADFSGLFHCLDAETGKVHWTYDLLSAAWGSPLIVENKVYIGDEDGELTVFELTAEPHEPVSEIDMRNSVYSTPIVAHNTLFISNKTHLFAIAADPEE